MNLNQNIVIIDYYVGNTHSVFNTISFLGYRNLKISDNEKEIKNADILILPGVGAFDEAIKNIREKNLDTVLNEAVLKDKKPILGICVGMQMLSEGSEENGWHEGLCWISGKVKKLDPPKGFSVPHVGWNNIIIQEKTLFAPFKDNTHFYFDHSYNFETTEDIISAYCDYGVKVTAAVRKDNIFGVQFHPEKSQTSGLKLFRSFFNWAESC
jgi:glutamine amidotransferase